MSSELTEATAAPIEFDCRGETLTLHPLRFLEWGKLEQWMRSCVIKAARDTIKGADLSDAEKTLIIRDALRYSTTISVLSCLSTMIKKRPGTEKKAAEQKAEISDEMAFFGSFEGMLRTVLLSVEKGREITIEELDKLFGSDTMLIAEAFSEVLRISLGTEQEDKASEKNPETAE